MATWVAHSLTSHPPVEPEPPVLTFGIPLRSAITTANWPRICALLDHTLASALAQPHVAAIVACHEQPHSIFMDDPRVTFLQASSARPAVRAAQLQDKRHKKNMVLDEHCRRGGGYIMILDADDLVSNQLSGHVARDDNGRGYLLSLGHVYDVRRRHVKLTPRFDRRCGSCAIFYLSPDDVANGWTATLADTPHRRFGDIAAQAGRPLDPIAFPASLYVFNHGENLSTTGASGRRVWLAGVLDITARVINTLVLGRGGNAVLRAEFGLADT